MSNITAKVIADSVSAVNGKRITTYELEFPRFILPEFNTHRMISKNSASSRAIPVKTMLETICNSPAMPSHWGKNESGMQANEEHDAFVYYAPEDCFTSSREGAWRVARDNACEAAKAFAKAGYHKQIVNRLTEPFQMIKVVATATEWDNFFWLRKHKDAQPEIRILAEKMWEARAASTPEVLQPGEWHTPYVAQCVNYNDKVEYYIGEPGQESFRMLTKEQALKVSASMCAQVSYRKADDTLEKALMIYDRLVESKPVHASPFEHCATPMLAKETGRGALNTSIETTQEGVTCHHKTLGFMSGNFAGWIQHRQLIECNTCWNYKE